MRSIAERAGMESVQNRNESQLMAHMYTRAGIRQVLSILLAVSGMLPVVQNWAGQHRNIRGSAVMNGVSQFVINVMNIWAGCL